MKKILGKEIKEFRVLLRSVPGVVLAGFLLSIFAMNLLANKSITLPVDWLALDCGILVSWCAFLTMDILTRHFGPKAATEISVFAILLNMLACFIFFIGSIIPGAWGESFSEGNEALLNHALDRTFGGTWYVVLGSTLAFLISAAVNNVTNWGIGNLFRKNPNGYLAYITRTYLSTAIGQFTDNLVFALAVSHVFFGWSLLQCVTCALSGMAVELLCEVIFSYFGYRICEGWRRDGVGEAYFALREADRKDVKTQNPENGRSGQ